MEWADVVVQQAELPLGMPTYHIDVPGSSPAFSTSDSVLCQCTHGEKQMGAPVFESLLFTWETCMVL